MSKYQNTMYNRYNRVKTQVNDLYRRAKTFKVSFNEYLNMKKKYHEATKHDQARLNNFYKGCIYGMETLNFNILQNTMEWKHFTLNEDGSIKKKYNSYSDIPKDILKDCYSAHFWPDTDILWNKPQKIKHWNN